ncbi:dihydrofolate reductase family protein [Streptomyces uncialis]|uniref:dihydrofolate reductase family protein n=1 Tax=Streptomyces uncialis TaxID=1048205 RepID=UPI00386E1E99|nr:dihydrofolate reductase family protein [Streptomyces uncialis]
MGHLAAVEFMSLDGVTQSVLSPDEDRDGGFGHGGWVPPYVDATVESFMSTATAGAAALLLGRRTYGIFAATWPYADASDPAVAAMNAMPKYVVSRSRPELTWENSFQLGDDLPAELARVRRETDGEILVLGSGELLRTLIELDAVDEYRLLTFPLLLGTGKRLFDQGAPPRRLVLVDSGATENGVLVTTYRRAAPGDGDRDGG